ncbi:hypothetical protein [Candidatus Solincola tengchongensis]|uniref:hypothetical protein n=1 Tax=Candidatus Solincola tengchongensis TaxID=2900693 RepID=UPI00257BF830|nr:hypothetical protein [Candidatus Solincola tengchongensis]
MKETVSPRPAPARGIPEASRATEGLGERLLRRLIKSPKFKSSLKILVNAIDEENAPGLVRALMWEDVETFMGAASALPRAVNFAVRAVEEMVAQLNAFPPEMLLAFLSRLAAEVDFEALERTAEEARLLLEKLAPVLEGLRGRMASAVGAGSPGREEEGV